MIENAFVGPFTAIDRETTLRNSEIEYSIVLADCTIEDVRARIECSLIGRGVKVARTEGKPWNISLVLGDSSSIRLT